MRRLITNVDIVTPDAVLTGSALLIDDGRILAIDPLGAGVDAELDGQGALCLPGMVDLHCDAIEKEVEPRPGAGFEHDFALANSDRRNLHAGITSVFHAISFAGGEFGVRDPAVAAKLSRTVAAYPGLVDHFLHARYEITDSGGEEPLLRLLDDDIVDLLSFMDHSPGQGQFRDMAAYVAYMMRTYHIPAAEAERIGSLKSEARVTGLERQRRLAEAAQVRRVPLASHDDDDVAKVLSMATLGVTISEFPIALEPAKAAVAGGLATLFGAPNVLRGRSTGGNVRALDAILAGACTGLCSDYHPPSLLAAILALPRLTPMSLPEAVRLGSLQPARAAGLADRGAILPGQRADVILVRHGLVEAVLVAGRLVLDTVDRTCV